MDAEIALGVGSAAVSVVGAVAAGVMTTWSAQRTRRYESLIAAQQKAQSKAKQAEAILSRYREPLLNAVQNLHSRLYTIVEHNVLDSQLHCGDPDLERYARDYTVYVFAEYLCWAEIIRHDLRFLDLGTESLNRELVGLLEANQLAIASETMPKPLRLFRGQQRAIGELMMTSTGDTVPAQYESLGYVRFCEQLDNDPAFARWFRRLRDNLEELAEARHADQAGVVALQHSLVDLIEFADPQQLRLPARFRDRLTSPNSEPPTAGDG
jgi:hypothetical protein